MHISEKAGKWVIGMSFILSLLLHLSPLQKDITGVHSWRQCQTMWNIRNFTRHDANILNPRVSHFNFNEDNLYRYEFPVMQWSIGMIQRITGEDIRIVRFSIFLICCTGILFFYVWIRVLGVSILAALLSSLLLEFSSLFYLYTINPIPDMLAISAGMGYLYYFFRFIKSDNYRFLVFSLISLAISTASKLPFLMFGIVSIIYFFKSIPLWKGNHKNYIRFILLHMVFIIPILFWYAWVIPSWKGNGILHGIFSNQISWAETGKIIIYHLTVMFPGWLMHPYSALLLLWGAVIIFRRSDKYASYFTGILGICFLYLILQFNMINVVHDYYMLPFLPVLYSGIAYGIQALLEKNKKPITFLLLLLVFLSPIIAFQFNKKSWTVAKSYFNPDFINHSEELSTLIPQDERIILINDPSYFVQTYMVDKMGYVFANDYLPIHWIDDMVRNKHIHYMYSDSRIVDEGPEFQKYIRRLLLETGSVRVFELQLPEK